MTNKNGETGRRIVEMSKPNFKWKGNKMFKKTPAGVCMSLEEFNRIQRAAGLPERVAVKKSNKKNQNANRAARAEANREMKANRQKRGK